MADLLANRTVLIAGLGNIGSHLGPLLLRAGVGRLRIVDRDTVEARNLATQDCTPDDVGRPKAIVQAERLRRLFPGRTIEAFALDLEDLPLGVAACDLVLGGLDSRRARQVLVSDMAWPQGVPVVDGGVGDAGLGRVQVFVPGDAGACLECTWGAADYRLASAEYPCIPGGSATSVPTAAPAHLGACIASLMVHEAFRLLAGDARESYEIVLDVNQHHMKRFGLRRSSRCRHDHEITTRTVPSPLEVEDLADVVRRHLGDGSVRLEGRHLPWRFATLQTLLEQGGRLNGPVPGDRIRCRSATGGIWLEVGG